MEIYYNSKGIENFLDVDLGESLSVEQKGYDYKIKMIQENNIPCLIKPIDSEIDGCIWLKYNTNFAYVLERLFTYVKPDGNLLKIIIGQICKLIIVLKKYFLEADELVISPEYMFYDCEKKVLSLLYIPGYNKPVRLQLKSFMEFVMRNFDHRDMNGVEFMYKVYELVAWEGFSEDSINQCISWCENYNASYVQAYGRVIAENIHEPDIRFAGKNREIYNLDEDVGTLESDINKIKNIKNFTWHEPVFVINAIFIFMFVAKYFAFGKNEADIIISIILVVIMIIHALFYVEKDDEEQDMDEAMEQFLATPSIKEESYKPLENKVGKLVPLMNGALDVIDINDNAPVVIGRGRKESDYRLATTQISRIHACVYCRDGNVFLEDKNSTNGTFINSNRLPANEQVKINRGDIVSFANIEFFAS